MKTLKNTLITFSILAIITPVQAQNLVPNPSFEEHSNCPDELGQTYLANGWNINIHTADYYHKCGESNVSIPLNSTGYQYPTDTNCNSYMGIFTRGFNNDSKEGIGCELINPLIIGQKYFISFKVSLADTYTCGLNKIGLIFTNHFYGYNVEYPHPLVNNFAHTYSEEIITDTSGWKTITGSFIADSSYNYIIIGHFFDDEHTSFTCFDSSQNGMSYYYIDDVCVSTDSAYCCDYNFTCEPNSSKEILNGKFSIYPNPAEKYVNIEIKDYNKNEKISIELYNTLGKLVFEKQLTCTNNKIYTEHLKAGVYFIKLYNNNDNTVKKILIR